MKNPTPLQRTGLAAGLLVLASASALAGDGLASLAYAGGEALAPEHEARLLSMITTPGGSLTRDEVRRQLAEARQDGTLAEAGEIAETPRVLVARSSANERQVREILAAQEAERTRLAAAAAEAEARRQAQVTVLAQAAPADPAAAEAVSGSPAAEPAAIPPALADAAGPAPAVPGDERDDRPGDGPADRPALAPLELPATRPSELPVETLIDKD